MKSALLSLILLIAVSLSAVSIYDIQFTTVAGIDNTYPSRYTGKIVSIEGIVTAVDYKNDAYFLSERINGPWRGIMISDRKNRPNIGDLVMLTGTVRETFGMTCLQDLSSFRILDSNLTLPQALSVTTGQLNRADQAEAYEGVFIRVLNSTCSQSMATKNRFYVTDGTGQCQVRQGDFGDRVAIYASRIGEQYNSISGILIYAFGEYALSPRSRTDIVVMQPVFNQNRSWGRIKSIYK